MTRSPLFSPSEPPISPLSLDYLNITFLKRRLQSCGIYHPDTITGFGFFFFQDSLRCKFKCVVTHSKKVFTNRRVYDIIKLIKYLIDKHEFNELKDKTVNGGFYEKDN